MIGEPFASRIGGAFAFRIGEKKRIVHQLVSHDETDFLPENVIINIYRVDPTQAELDETAPPFDPHIVEDGAGVVEPPNEDAKEHKISYLWDLATVPAGSYAYYFTYDVDEETFTVKGSVDVLPLLSKLDRFTERTREIICETEAGESERQLTEAQVLLAVRKAVRQFDHSQPLRKVAEEDISVDGPYTLPDDWLMLFSKMAWMQYDDPDLTEDERLLPPGALVIEDYLRRWRFAGGFEPLADQTDVVFLYTTRNVLDHSTDTIPQQFVESVCQWAAGESLSFLANLAAQSNAPSIAADFVNYRSKQMEFQAQAKEMKRAAEAEWSKPPANNLIRFAHNPNLTEKVLT